MCVFTYKVTHYNVNYTYLHVQIFTLESKLYLHSIVDMFDRLVPLCVLLKLYGFGNTLSYKCRIAFMLVWINIHVW